MAQLLSPRWTPLVDTKLTCLSGVRMCCREVGVGTFSVRAVGIHFQCELANRRPMHLTLETSYVRQLGISQSLIRASRSSSIKLCATSQSELTSDGFLECPGVQPELIMGNDSEAPDLSSRRISEMQTEASKKIRQLAKSGSLTQAMDVMENLHAAGVQPDAIAATALVDCCVRCNDLSRAERVFESLFDSAGSLRPDGIAFSVLVRGFGAETPPQWIKIQKLMARMETEYFTKPTVAVYNELLDICVRTNDIDKGTELLDKMRASDISPDYQTVEAIKRKRMLRSHFKKVFSDKV